MPDFSLRAGLKERVAYKENNNLQNKTERLCFQSKTSQQKIDIKIEIKKEKWALRYNSALTKKKGEVGITVQFCPNQKHVKNSESLCTNRRSFYFKRY